MIYNLQALPGSQKFRTWCFSPTPYTEYNVIQALDTYKIFNDTTGHGPQITSYFSLKYTNFPYKIIYLHLQSSSASREWKHSNFVRFADPEHRLQRDSSVTLRKFSSDATRNSLRITKRPAVWFFPYFSFTNTNSYWKIFYLYLESSSASRECENSNVVLFADPVVHSVRRHPRVTLKINFSSDSTKKNSKYCKETVKWGRRMYLP